MTAFSNVASGPGVSQPDNFKQVQRGFGVSQLHRQAEDSLQMRQLPALS